MSSAVDQLAELDAAEAERAAQAELTRRFLTPKSPTMVQPSETLKRQQEEAENFAARHGARPTSQAEQAAKHEEQLAARQREIDAGWEARRMKAGTKARLVSERFAGGTRHKFIYERPIH